jgi:hypothetical protein
MIALGTYFQRKQQREQDKLVGSQSKELEAGVVVKKLLGTDLYKNMLPASKGAFLKKVKTAYEAAPAFIIELLNAGEEEALESYVETY